MNDLRIVTDPRVHLGKPCIKGTRIPVDEILRLVSAGIDFDVIARDYYPEITSEDVKVCVEYARRLVSAEEFYAAEPE